MTSSAGPTKSQASARSDRFTRRLRQRLLQRRQLLESLRHRGGAADDVVHDGDGLAVVLAEPRLLERVDRAALLYCSPRGLRSTHRSFDWMISGLSDISGFALLSPAIRQPC